MCQQQKKVENYWSSQSQSQFATSYSLSYLEEKELLKDEYSESRLMLSIVNVISRLM
jgi:hypothetical protein